MSGDFSMSASICYVVSLALNTYYLLLNILRIWLLGVCARACVWFWGWGVGEIDNYIALLIVLKSTASLCTGRFKRSFLSLMKLFLIIISIVIISRRLVVNIVLKHGLLEC